MLINGEKREAYNKLVAYLTSPEFQQKMMEQTLRRPDIPQVKLSADFASPLLVELAFPNDLAAIDKLLFAYEDKHRRSSHAYFVLDVSGSMAGGRMQSLQSALKNLTGQDQTLSGRFSRFRNRETLTFIPFDNQVYPAKTFTINDPGSQSADMQAVRQYIDSLQPMGQTAIYQALQAAYRMALEARHKDPDRFYSIVLMSDGENNSGLSEDEFAQFIAALEYLPDMLETYLALPPAFARLHPMKDGKTATQIFIEQLQLLDGEMKKLAVDILKDDTEALIIHGNFLRDKFQGSNKDWLGTG
jgi:Ca-activated chloride channel family protein